MHVMMSRRRERVYECYTRIGRKGVRSRLRLHPLSFYTPLLESSNPQMSTYPKILKMKAQNLRFRFEDSRNPRILGVDLGWNFFERRHFEDFPCVWDVCHCVVPPFIRSGALGAIMVLSSLFLVVNLRRKGL
jgi:hypothetical protein